MKNHIIGIGGIFFKAQNPKELGEWYKSHLGIAVDAEGNMAMLKWREAETPENEHLTVWSPFPSDTTYFNPGTASFMINYIVDDLDQTLADLRAQGVQVDDRVDDYDHGRFGWATDPEGNRFELWEPTRAK